MSPEDLTPTSSMTAEFQAFAVEHPWDFKAQDDLAMKLFGHHVMVALDGSTSATTGTEAAKVLASVHHERLGVIQPMAMPSDLFTVARSTVDIGTGIVAMGSWQFKSSWAGQAAPYDIAALEFSMSSCHRFTNYTAATSSQAGKSTHLGTLRDGGAGSHAPTWNVNDYENGFVSQAYKGAVSVVVTKGSCATSSQVGFQFRYEANQGGGLASVSAGWGILSVSYSGSSLHLQKSTTAGYFAI